MEGRWKEGKRCCSEGESPSIVEEVFPSLHLFVSLADYVWDSLRLFFTKSLFIKLFYRHVLSHSIITCFPRAIVGLFGNRVMVQQPRLFLVRNFVWQPICWKREAFDNRVFLVYDSSSLCLRKVNCCGSLAS